jgi:hypothetical protein
MLRTSRSTTLETTPIEATGPAAAHVTRPTLEVDTDDGAA